MIKASVIIAGYYSAATINITLDSLQRQTVQDFETIVVNSSPETETGELTRTRYPRVRFYQHPSRLLMHAARNKGVELSRGKLLLFTDPDLDIHPRWVEKMITAHENGILAMTAEMGCRQTSWWLLGVHLVKFHEFLPGTPHRIRPIAPTASAGYDAELFRRIGGFRGDLVCGDAVISWQISRNEPIRIIRGVPVLHIHVHTLKKLVLERSRRGFEFMRERLQFENWSKRKRLLHMVLFPMLPFYVLLLAGRNARAAGWFGAYILTLPLQFIGQLSWCWGEFRAQINSLRAR